MQGWTIGGKGVRLYPEQAHVVMVLLGRKEPDEDFDRFWRMRGVGRETALATAARYAEADYAHTGLMGGLDLAPKIYDHELLGLGEAEVRRIARQDPGRISRVYHSGDLRGAPLPPAVVQ